MCTIINVICVMQSMSATPADIYTNVLTNTTVFSNPGKHLKNNHRRLYQQLFPLKKCNGKLDCLIYELFFIKKIRPCLNTQTPYAQNYLLNFVTFLLTYFYIYILRLYMHILRFIASYSRYFILSRFYSFSLENDDMES